MNKISLSTHMNTAVFPTHKSKLYLQAINGVRFTSRELDIIACLLSGRSAKAIASFLDMAEATVTTHIRNIMVKLECNSRDSIRDFVEKSDKFSLIKTHYTNLLLQTLFKEQLQTITGLINKESYACLIVYGREDTSNADFIYHLENYLKFTGIKTFRETENRINQFSYLIRKIESQAINHIIYNVPEKLVMQLDGDDSKEKSSFENFIEYSHQNPGSVIFLIREREYVSIISQETCVNLSKQENYYLSTFEILRKILHDISFDKAILEFKQKCEAISGNVEQSFCSMPVKGEKFLQVKNSANKDILLSFLKKINPWLFAYSIIFPILGLVILLFFVFNPKKIVHTNQHREIVKPTSIRTDLPLPTETMFLLRPSLLNAIKEKLGEQSGIQVVALIGIGGAGKTTLARQYARQQNSTLIWEINADTRESVASSFKKLAYALSNTENKKKILKGLQDIKDSKEREESIIVFVKKELQHHSGWLLLYDNLEKFTDIQQYFPSDPLSWGRGVIIVTTRDSNIQNNIHINKVIKIPVLNSNEKLSLYTKIMTNGEIAQFTGLQVENAKNFLSNLPPFPLDISIAAYYIKATNVSYKRYLEHLRVHDNEFSTLQGNLLKDVNNYTKTRYNIITLSIKKLIDSHKDFGKVLLFVCLLDSQNIPRDLLDLYKGKIVVDNLIYNLKKYSLILEQSSSPSISDFSIHKCTQEISLAYCIKALHLEKNHQLFQEIVHILESYLAQAISEEDILKMQSLVKHLDVFLNHYILSDEIHSIISVKLGIIYFYLGDYIKAQYLLEKSLPDLGKYKNKNYRSTAQALMYLGMVHRERGDYQKAKTLLEQSVLILKNNPAKGQVDLAPALEYLGIIYRSLGDYKKARELLKQSSIIYESHFPKGYVGIARASVYLGNIYRDLGDYKKARKLLEQSLLLYENHFPEDHVGIARALVYLGNIYRDLGNYKKAKKLLEQSLSIFKKYFSEDHPKIAWVLVNLGGVYKEQENYQKAKICFEKSEKIYNKHFGKNHIKVSWSLVNLADTYKKEGNYKKARNLFEDSLLVYKNTYGTEHIETARLLRDLGQIYLLENQMETAENYINQALRIFDQDKHPESYTCLESLADLHIKKLIFLRNEKHNQKVKNLKKSSIAYLKRTLILLKTNFPGKILQIKKIQSQLKELEE